MITKKTRNQKIFCICTLDFSISIYQPGLADLTFRMNLKLNYGIWTGSIFRISHLLVNRSLDLFKFSFSAVWMKNGIIRAFEENDCLYILLKRMTLTRISLCLSDYMSLVQEPFSF